MRYLSELNRFFSEDAPLRPGSALLTAFSGGADSTALLWGLTRLAPELGLRLHAVHVDHDMDPDSRRRAAQARTLCRQLEVSCTTVTSSVPREARRGESLEVAARRIRYRVLEDHRRRLDASYIATAHHADDQAETVILRILQGSGTDGLVGVRALRGKVVRPLLPFRRSELRRVLQTTRLEPIVDPTNWSLESVRNRVRHLVLPRLQQEDLALPDRLVSLAEAAAGARTALRARLGRRLGLQRTVDGPALRRRALEELPFELWPHALAMLHREAKLPYPPGQAARRELLRQLRNGDLVGCDCGDGWRWETCDGLLRLVRQPPPTPSFAYTLQVPGHCEIPELALRFRMRRGPVAAWMFQNSPRRAGLDLPLQPGDRVVIRSRRPGDRLRPLGCAYRRRLKDVLIDRGVPRRGRGRLALLEVGARLAWVPGVTIEDTFRLEAAGQAWIAELEPL